jgi:hypothetical protein
MARPIQYRYRYTAPAETVYGTLVDRDYLEARLRELGGRNAALVELTASPESARVVLRHGVGREQLPGPIQPLFSGDLMVERTESWRRTAPGQYDGNVTASVAHTPGQIGGTMRLADTDGTSGSEYSIDGTAKVSLPLVGGKIESVIVDQITQLMASESQFTARWLNR